MRPRLTMLASAERPLRGLPRLDGRGSQTKPALGSARAWLSLRGAAERYADPRNYARAPLRAGFQGCFMEVCR